MLPRRHRWRFRYQIQHIHHVCISTRAFLSLFSFFHSDTPLLCLMMHRVVATLSSALGVLCIDLDLHNRSSDKKLLFSLIPGDQRMFRILKRTRYIDKSMSPRLSVGVPYTASYWKATGGSGGLRTRTDTGFSDSESIVASHAERCATGQRQARTIKNLKNG